MKRLIVILGLMVWFGSMNTAKADCINPEGKEGVIIYNGEHKVAQFCNGTQWVGMAGGSTSIMTGDTMVEGWPDAIMCSYNSRNIFLYMTDNPASSIVRYKYVSSDGVDYSMDYSASSQDFSSHAGLSVWDCVTNSWSISDLYAQGQAFNFVGGQGNGSGGSADNLGNHTATQNLDLSTHKLVGNGGSTGVYVDADGNVGIGTADPQTSLSVVRAGTSSQIQFGITNTSGGYLTSVNTNNSVLSGGAEYVSGSWIARSTAASHITLSGGNVSLTADHGLTAGNSYSPTSRLHIKGDTGNVGIGTTDPQESLDVVGKINASSTITSGGNMWAGNSLVWESSTASGATLCYGNGSGYYVVRVCSSLRAYKKNIKDLSIGLETVMKLRPRIYDWKTGETNDLGFIAEEVEKIDPRLVVYDRGKLRSVKYRQMTSLLTKAVQELKAENNALREEMQAANDNFRRELDELKAAISD